ncbi:sensor histidine kinase, partial [Paenibacillus sp. TAF58]
SKRSKTKRKSSCSMIGFGGSITSWTKLALYPSLEFILYRNAQEAITNAIRHGSATQVLIQLTYEPKQITMCISNNGKLPNERSRNGLGMSGMEERSKLIGGQLIVPIEDRFTVMTVLPTFRQIEST